MTGLFFILILLLFGAGLFQAHKWGYDKGYHDGYDDGDYEGYSCGIEDSNRQFQNMCDEVIKKKEGV